MNAQQERQHVSMARAVSTLSDLTVVPVARDSNKSMESAQTSMSARHLAGMCVGLIQNAKILLDLTDAFAKRASKRREEVDVWMSMSAKRSPTFAPTAAPTCGEVTDASAGPGTN